MEESALPYSTNAEECSKINKRVAENFPCSARISHEPLFRISSADSVSNLGFVVASYEPHLRLIGRFLHDLVGAFGQLAVPFGLPYVQWFLQQKIYKRDPPIFNLPIYIYPPPLLGDFPAGYGGHIPSIRFDIFHRNTAFDRRCESLTPFVGFGDVYGWPRRPYTKGLFLRHLLLHHDPLRLRNTSQEGSARKTLVSPCTPSCRSAIESEPSACRGSFLFWHILPSTSGDVFL